MRPASIHSTSTSATTGSRGSVSSSSWRRFADESRWTAARDALIARAARLGLGESERRSYLVMLLEQTGFDEG